MNLIKKFKLFTLFLISLIITSCSAPSQNSNVVPASGILEVHFIDVGQADCSLIKLPDGGNVLIDAGNRDDHEYIRDYLKNQGISHLDAVVGTHPHEDHIGSMRYLLADFDVDKILLPEGDYDSMVYTNMLYSIEENEVEEIRVTEDYSLTVDNVEFFIIPAKENYKGDPNNISLVCKMNYGETAFLFTGDIEKEREADILNENYDLSADVLKVAHHGSRTSSTDKFLKAVAPEIAVIQVGEGNDYGLPNDETIEKLKAIGSQVYRTDELGDIVIKTDGSNLSVGYGDEEETVDTESTAELILPEENSEDKDTPNIEIVTDNSYIGNKNTKVYHSEGCGSLPAEGNRVYFASRNEAENEGYKGHSSCVK